MSDVPESVLTAFNKQLDRYITIWTGAIRRHVEKLKGAKALRRTKHSSMSVNDALVHRQVHHHIGVQRYALSFTGDAQSILDDAQQAIIDVIQGYADPDGNIDPSVVDKMLATLAVIQDDARAALEHELESELEEFVQYEAENEVNLLSDELPDDVEIDMPTLDELDAIISDVAFQGRYIDDWIGDFTDAGQTRTKALIVGGLQKGLLAGALIASLRASSFTVEARQWENVVRTIWNGAANWAKGLVYQKNSDVISQVQWHATLDEVTCEICAALDGQVFNVEDLDPPPAHPSCRCFITAVVQSADRISRISRQHARAIRKAHPDHQARLTGKPAQKLRYVDWLKRQSAEVQDEALGPTRGRLFRIGHIDIRKFINHRRQILTLDQLRKRDAAAFERARIAA